MMQQPHEQICLGSLIEVLEIYLGTLEEENIVSEEVKQMHSILFWCHNYLTIYKNSVNSMERIKDTLELLSLQKMSADPIHQ